jgi:hypothetical protein
MQAEAELAGVFDKCGQPIEAEAAEPDYKMHSSLMRADFNVLIRKAS